MVWIPSSNTSLFDAVIRHYEMRGWVLPLPGDGSVRPERCLLGAVQDRLGMEPSASFQVGDLLHTAYGTRIPEVEKVIKCVIRILARPVRIVSLVAPLHDAPRDAIITEYHPIDGMTSEEIER